MPFSPSPRARSGPRRRSLLAVGPAALALAGCTAGGEDSGDPGDGPSAADRRARARAARDSEELAERYDAVIAARPELAERLRPLRGEVVRHARAFDGGRKASPSPAVSPSASSASSASSSPSAAAVPGNDRDALAVLAAAERDLADRRAKALVGVDGELARLLASVAAAGAAHVYLLTEGDA
ncbi:MULTISPECIES: hypothetical protein [Streptomyces]|uniref:Lipoprotein n=1 Tax=Streptomyces koelreuteriae TaxID=2838015 RepID=A0ABX8FNI9_9ACTN|nr:MULTISPECIES: hypothetical protein [Streptomyces]QWB22731.1 hypothetical protein KJK29_09130 [Streptomyces koelreuteriae]UUA05680.1 hypothetical protein NNW98_09175 [Streptomyces koelreuteriae]UUA13307.1 hypothetical protein NNW99_09175 [Streptomyces sp. CRCS-T-1]